MTFTVDRPTVLWLGELPSNLQPFNERGLQVEQSDPDRALQRFPSARACVFVPQLGRLGLLLDSLRRLGEEAVNHGLLLEIVAPDFAAFRQLDAIQKAHPLGPFIHVTPATDLNVVAERIVRHNPGPEYVPISFTLVTCASAPRFLLSRAFSDCTKIEVEALHGGRVSDGVFCVHAWFSNSLVGPRPRPFFAKLSTPDAIRSEMWMYREYAEQFIPFYLCPNVVERRCVFGFGQALMVGNFVEGAVPLRTALKQGSSQGPIHSLFDHSLRGLRLQAFANPHVLSNDLGWSLEACAQIEKIPESRVKTAIGLLCSRVPQDIMAVLKGKAKIPYRWAPRHGDLHDGNVMVRGDDSILIDLASITNGPLSADPASLEVSLVFNVEAEDHTNFEEWRQIVDAIYANTRQLINPPLCEPSKWEWLWNAVRQIRLVGCANLENPDEFPLVLAAHLLRFARLPADTHKDPAVAEFAEKRHAYACVIADRIAGAL
jgi:hypothetical protein